MVFYNFNHLCSRICAHLKISPNKTKQNKTFSAQSVSHQKSLVLHKLREKMFHPLKCNSKMENKFHTFQIMSCFFFFKEGTRHFFTFESHKNTRNIFGFGQATQTVKNLPAMQETRVRPLGWEDPLEEETATHSSILAWRILWRAVCPTLCYPMGCM